MKNGKINMRIVYNRFLICGLSCNVQVNPKYAEQAQVFVLDKREMHCTERGLVQGRILNGDERNYMALGTYPSLQEIAFYRK